MADYNETVNEHYATGDLGAVILNALAEQGKDVNALQVTDLAPIDQFHSRGREATDELAAMAQLRAGETVLDVGGGMGGSARVLAQEFGCTVTVLDLTQEFVRVGELLTARTQMQDRVQFQLGSALEIPFEDNVFDVAWSQHSTMNIGDKPKLFAEMYRVLKPGGRYALYEIMAGPNSPAHYPVPWATTPDISFLETPEMIRAQLETAGFRQVAWQEQTDAAHEFFRQRIAAIDSGVPPPALGLHLFFQERFVPAFRNIFRNFEEKRLRVVMAVFEK